MTTTNKLTRQQLNEKVEYQVDLLLDNIESQYVHEIDFKFPFRVAKRVLLRMQKEGMGFIMKVLGAVAAGSTIPTVVKFISSSLGRAKEMFQKGNIDKATETLSEFDAEIFKDFQKDKPELVQNYREFTLEFFEAMKQEFARSQGFGLDYLLVFHASVLISLFVGVLYVFNKDFKKTVASIKKNGYDEIEKLAEENKEKVKNVFDYIVNALERAVKSVKK